MARIAYVNGAYRPHRAAGVSIDDRGYQFADAVYEVFAVAGGRPVDSEAHFDRLERSLDAVRIPRPMSRAALGIVVRELIRRNRVRFGLVYLQVSRGVASRAHAFPADIRPSVVGTARGLAPDAGDALAQAGVAVITLPDIRWARRDIKTTALLPNVLARQRAAEHGAYEAWFVDGEGVVTEGAATNAWIVDSAGRLVTRPLGEAILHGVTRRAVLALARQANHQVVERGFTVAEARAAREAFLTSATSFVLPVVRIDDTMIGDGSPGPVTAALRALYCDWMPSSP